MPVQMTNHGGAYSCCGMRHLAFFDDYWTQMNEDLAVQLMTDERARVADQNEVDDLDESISDLLFEAVLTEDQMMTWREPMRRMGFRVVTKFQNLNSDNVVYVLHHVKRIPLRNVRPGG